MKTTMATLRNQAKQAPKYVLHLESMGYLAENQNLNGVVFTPEIELAMDFAVGFDNPEMKIGIWSATASRQIGMKVKFEAIAI